MQTTMNLLERAIAVAPIPTWTAKLKLSRDAIATAKHRGKLSPVIAGGLALELNEDPQKWMTLAIIEGEKPSAAKDLLVKQLRKIQKL